MPLSYKLGSNCGPGPRRPWDHVWTVDGFAGTGAYRPDGEGAIQDGSPLIAAKWARKLQIERGYPLMRCINVEANPDNFAELERRLAPWQDVAICLPGAFADHVEAIIETIGSDPALVFLDPFGVKGIEMDVIEKLLDRGPHTKTELLVHFSDRTVKRMAGHMNETAARKPVGVKTARSELRQLDRVIGTPMWRRIWDSELETKDAMDRIADLYLSELSRRIGYAGQVLMRDNYPDTPAYRLVFCTGSPHGMEQVSHLAHRYETELKEHYRPGQTDFFSDHEEREHLTALRDDIQALGLRRQLATPLEIRHALIPERFGLYSTTDYARAIRELVGTGVIQRENTVAIKDSERLHFVGPAQTSLLGS